jgi:hypothetical protein
MLFVLNTAGVPAKAKIVSVPQAKRSRKSCGEYRGGHFAPSSRLLGVSDSSRIEVSDVLASLHLGARALDAALSVVRVFGTRSGLN